jgi:glycosyltransferase involved in cell wall biosynthesis
VDRKLAAADALILPSYDEGLTLAILEALALGVPVICTPVGEIKIPQFLQHGRTALMVQPGGPAGIAATLADLVANLELREHLSRAGRSPYEERFSLRRFAAAVFSIHQRCFDCSPPQGAVDRASRG